MSRQTKRKYRNARIEFKKDLTEKCETNKALCMLIVETYAAWHHRRHITKIWAMFLNPAYKDFQKDYNETLFGKHLSGRDDIWRSLYFSENELHEKHFGKLPEVYAMGDALAVAYRVLKKR